MITLREINEENYEKCMSLKLTKEQSLHMASNSYSLVEAYATRNTPDIYFPYAVYKDEEMVGFVMYNYSPFIENDDEYDDQGFYISRMMIDVKYQNMGYGKEALAKTLEIMNLYIDAPVDYIALSCSPQNKIAYKLYEKMGFEFKGEMDDDDDHLLIMEK